MFIFLPVTIYSYTMLFRFKKSYNEGNFLKNKEVKSLNALVTLHQLKLRSYHLDRKIKVDLYLPSETNMYKSALILNDGQDMEQLGLVKTFSMALSRVEIPNIGIIAIHANENRMQEYGVAGFPDFRKRGKRAGRYSDFVTKELTPFLQREYGLMKENHPNVFAGFSMGGLSALDITWNNPQLFKKTGVFSGSLWWRTLNTGTGKDDASRIMHRRIRESEKREGLKFWFQTGTKDELKDRNKNGIIDSIDDTCDFIKELKSLGYTDEDIVYEEVKDGQHNFQTWSRIFPQFLLWAFPKKKY